MNTKHTNKQDVNAIIQSLVMVKLTPHTWTGTMKANELAREIETTKGAEQGSCGATIYFLTEDMCSKIGTATSQMTMFWKGNTLPWLDGGWRVVSAKGYQSLMDGVAKYSTAYNEVAAEIADNYDSIKATAKRRLNGAFREEDFPSKEALQRKFWVEIQQNVISRLDDIRIEGLSDMQQSELKRSMEETYTSKIQSCVAEILESMRCILSDAMERLSRKEQDNIQYGSMQKVAARVCDSLSKLNITGDPDIERMIHQTKMSVTFVNGNALRESKQCRDDMTTRVKDLIEELNDFAA